MLLKKLGVNALLPMLCRPRFSKSFQRDNHVYSGALWQGSNSKIENYGFLAAMTLFEKVLQPFLACRRN